MIHGRIPRRSRSARLVRALLFLTAPLMAWPAWGREAAIDAAVSSASPALAGGASHSPALAGGGRVEAHDLSELDRLLAPRWNEAADAVPQGDFPIAWTWSADGLLPLPSDLYTVHDPTTPTTRRVRMPAHLYSDDLLKSAPFEAKRVLEQVNRMDGFSASTPLLVAIPAELEVKSLPTIEQSTKPESAVWLIDLDDHAWVPFRSRPMARPGKASTLLVIQPEDRLHSGHRYAVVVRDGLRDKDGKHLPEVPGFSAALRGSPDAEPSRRAAHARALGDALAGEGIDLGSIQLAFAFTVESDRSFLAPMRALDAKVEQRRVDRPYRVNELYLRRRLLKGSQKAALTGSGTFQALTFIDEQGRILAEPREQRLKFLIQLPATCPEGGCAVAVFGHGLGATKETMFQVADRFAAQGIATIGVGAPWHGNFVAPTKVILGTRKNLDLLHGLFIEHIMRNVQLVEVVKQGLSGFPLWTGRTADGRETPVQLRADQIFYIGQSMGGICGVATTVLANDIKAAVFDVAGGGGVDLLFDSWVAKLMRLSIGEFAGMDAGASDRMLPLAASLFNDFDPVGFAPYLTTSPLPGERARMVTQQVGLGDGLVPNWTSEKLARAIGIDVVRPADKATTLTLDREGPGLRYFRFTGHWFLAHIELMWPGSSRSAAEFFAWSRRQLEPAPQADARVAPPR